MTKYYQLKDFEIEQWSYICEHPTSSEYVILLNDWTKQPKRFSKNEMLEMFSSYKEALIRLIDELERVLTTYKKELTELDDNKEQ